MPLDGVSARCLAGELNQSLTDARVDRIFQPDRFDICLLLRQGNRNLRLLLSANPAAPRIHLTQESRENPGTPPMFCMLLRKHLLGARLLSVSTPGYERIFRLRFLTTNELGDKLDKYLVVEIMGRHSNIILLNHEDRIHDAIQHIDDSISRVREVMPARCYVLPPDQAKPAPDQVLAALDAGRPWLNPAAIGRPLDQVILASVQGFSPLLCQELVAMADLDERLRPSQLDDTQNRRLDQAAIRLLTRIHAGAYEPTAYYNHPDATAALDFHALRLTFFSIALPCRDLSEAMDRYYLERSRQNTLQQKRQTLEHIIRARLEQVRRKLAIHDSDCREGERSNDYLRLADLILANRHLWQAGSESMTAVDYFDPELSEIRITLPEPERDAARNAQIYYRRYARARSRGENGRRFLEADLAEISWLESIQTGLTSAADLTDLAAIREELTAAGLTGERICPDLQPQADQQPGVAGSRRRRQSRQRQQKGAGKPAAKGPAPLPPRQYTSSDGLTILVGRNNLQNDQLTLKTAQKDDLWLHVQKLPGTHVIVRANRLAVPDRTIAEAAGIAAWFSRASSALPGRNRPDATGSSDGQKIAVDYCPVSQVRKPSGARPGHVIYDHYQTILVAPRDPAVLSRSVP